MKPRLGFAIQGDPCMKRNNLCFVRVQAMIGDRRMGYGTRHAAIRAWRNRARQAIALAQHEIRRQGEILNALDDLDKTL